MHTSHVLPMIPQGSRIVVRTVQFVPSETDASMKKEYHDFVGHVMTSTPTFITLERDSAANGSRPAQIVTLHADEIVRIKPVPERPFTSQ